MKHELEQLRMWATNRLQSGDVPEWAWQNHVTLIEAVDAVLRDMTLLNVPAVELDRRRSNHLRLVRDAAAQALTELSLEVTEPARYQRKAHATGKRARNLH